MNDLEKSEYKHRLINACKSHVMEIAENSRLVMEDSQKSANEYGQPKDRYDSYRAQLLTRGEMFATQYQQALEQLAVLEKIGVDQLHKKVEFGSVVITDKQKMFVATGCGKVDLDGDIYFAISPLVPIFLAMKGMKKGETINFRGQMIKILDVF
jgi:hypothetical protein